MATVVLRAPLSELCGGRDHALDGATVVAVLEALERANPAVRGWVLDERRRIRTHVNVYVNGEPAEEEDTVGDGDRVHVLPAITGGEL
jgi:molybdopterin converting factor small subunit